MATFIWTDAAPATANVVYLITHLPEPAQGVEVSHDRHSLSKATGVPPDVIMSDDPELLDRSLAALRS